MERTTVLAACLAAWLPLTVSCSKEREQEASPARESSATKSVAAPPSISGNGTITGKVVFKGNHSAGSLTVSKDKEVCGDAKQDPSLLVGNDGGLKNAVVQVPGLSQGKALSKEAVIDQSKCEYVPHVLVVPTGATVTIKNSDGILHNVHSLSQLNAPFNRAQPKFMKEIKETFAKPEIIPLRCDVHGWMTGWIIVTENAYFDVTQDDGAFKLADVPAGKYSLEVWHETLGSATQAVDLKAGEAVNVTFEFHKKQ